VICALVILQDLPVGFPCVSICAVMRYFAQPAVATCDSEELDIPVADRGPWVEHGARLHQRLAPFVNCAGPDGRETMWLVPLRTKMVCDGGI